MDYVAAKGDDEPINEDGFLKWMIDYCDLFIPTPDIKGMRQHEKLDSHLVDW